jgi:transposase-like protein
MLRRINQHWLSRLPAEKKDLSAYRYLIIDGTYIHQRKGIVAVMNAESHTLLYGAYGLSESPTDLFKLCTDIAQRGVSPISATIDGNPHMIKTLKLFWPGIIIQRCLVHIQRQGLSWCRRFPKRTDAKQLRKIFLRVSSIYSHDERRQFQRQLNHWEDTYGKRIARTPERGKVFSDLKRARSMLIAALPNMFHYLDNPLIPTSTNALEGYFSRLKQRYRQHRGLSVYQRSAYFKWFMYLCQR